MNSIIIEDIEIYYLEEKLNEIIKLKKLLNNNHSFIKSFLPKKIVFENTTLKANQDTLYLNSIEDYLDIIIKLLDTSPFLKDIKNNKQFLLYYEYLVHDNNKKEFYKTIFPNKDKNYILSLIGYLYYNKEDYHKYLKDKNEIDDKIILYSIREECRNKTIEELIKINNKYINNNNEETISYFKEHLNLFDTIYIKKDNKANNKFTPMREDEIDILFKSFLKEINPSNEWLYLYEKKKQDNDIIIINTNKKEEKNTSEYRNGKLYLEFNHNTHDFKVLAHEFIHLVVKEYYQDKKYHSQLEEFPSIYYEKKALDYLRNINIDEKEIENLKNIREEALIKNYEIMTELFLLITNKGKIEDKLKKLFNNLSSEEINEIIDEDTLYLIKYPEEIKYYYSYIIADYFTKRIDKENIDFQDEMIKIVKELKNISLKDLDERISQRKKKKKKKKKLYIKI